MGRPVGKSNKTKQKEKKLERIALIKKALELGVTTRAGLAKAADCTVFDVGSLLTNNPDLYNEYKVRRRTLSETAADNIEDIINDQNHPNNYAASKFIIQTYKSDIDKALEHQDSDELNVEIGKGENSPPVKISFAKKDKKKD